MLGRSRISVIEVVSVLTDIVEGVDRLLSNLTVRVIHSTIVVNIKMTIIANVKLCGSSDEAMVVLVSIVVELGR